ncbi:hypothetical protein PVL29_012749 [Vitis rotundifolia]|uniref:Uncharacterized protein n=1 Tax=Vitis rotundifolia TaxID=103349 RepID=A0AA39DND6_VITRO|nr:hypothetical protein PVL29_012749 [Vitis rotundifolia]
MVRTPYYSDVRAQKKGSWSPEEDQKLKAYIKRYGIWNWTEMPKAAGLSRSGKSCRLRWVNYLKPGIKRGNFSCKEEETILEMHKMLGNRWSAIAARLPGRTDNEIKNYWHTKLRKLKDNPAPRTKSQAPKTSTVEAKPIGSPKDASSMGSEHPWSSQLSIDDSSSSIASLAVGADEIQLEGNSGDPMSTQPFAYDSSSSVTSPAVGTEHPWSSQLSIDDSSSSITSLVVGADEIQLEGNSGDPMSTQPFAYDSSSSVTSPAVGTDKNQTMDGSTESERTFGDFQAFPVEDLFMLGDYFWETYPDLEFAFPICEEWVQEPLWT